MTRALRQIRLIAGLTLRETVHSGVLTGALILLALFIAGYAWLARTSYPRIDTAAGLSVSTRDLLRGLVFLQGLWAAALLSGLLGIVLGAGLVGLPSERPAAVQLLARPVRRGEFVAGRWLGMAVLLVLVSVVSVVAVAAVARVWAGVWPRNLTAGAGVLALSAVTMLTIATAGSAVLSTLANTVALSVLFVAAATAGFIEQVGAALPGPDAELLRAGIISGMLIPSDALYRLAAAEMAPAALLESRFPSLLTSLNPPTYWVAAWSAGLVVVAFAAACWLFRSKDL